MSNQGLAVDSASGSSSTSISLRNRKPLGVARQRFCAPFHQPAGHQRRQRLAPGRRSGRPVRASNSSSSNPSTRRKPFIANSNGKSADGNRLSHQRARIRREIAPRLARLLRAHDESARRIGELAVRAGADAEVVAEVPVVEVVGAARAGARIAGHLVLLETRLRAACAASGPASPRRCHRPAARAARPRTACRARSSGGIATDARDASASAASHVRLALRQRVCPGSAYIRSRLKFDEAGRVQFFGGATRFIGGMDAAQQLQLSRVETLRTERHAGDAGRAILGEPAALDRARDSPRA